VPYPGYNRAAHILPRLVSLAQELECPLVVVHTPKVSALEEPKGKEYIKVLLRERERGKSTLRIAVENAVSIGRPMLASSCTTCISCAPWLSAMTCR